MPICDLLPALEKLIPRVRVPAEGAASATSEAEERAHRRLVELLRRAKVLPAVRERTIWPVALTGDGHIPADRRVGQVGGRLQFLVAVCVLAAEAAGASALLPKGADLGLEKLFLKAFVLGVLRHGGQLRACPSGCRPRGGLGPAACSSRLLPAGVSVPLPLLRTPLAAPDSRQGGSVADLLAGGEAVAENVRRRQLYGLLLRPKMDGLNGHAGGHGRDTVAFCSRLRTRKGGRIAAQAALLLPSVIEPEWLT
mmetsp:Transcript_132086/g.423141  ORF Transcript_132086/g.423141 Transcript_132086/m.423141 type:complete len:253 (+) Transcript_132086:827-1585(+)